VTKGKADRNFILIGKIDFHEQPFFTGTACLPSGKYAEMNLQVRIRSGEEYLDSVQIIGKVNRKHKLVLTILDPKGNEVYNQEVEE